MLYWPCTSEWSYQQRPWSQTDLLVSVKWYQTWKARVGFWSTEVTPGCRTASLSWHHVVWRLRYTGEEAAIPILYNPPPVLTAIPPPSSHFQAPSFFLLAPTSLLPVYDGPSCLFEHVSTSCCTTRADSPWRHKGVHQLWGRTAIGKGKFWNITEEGEGITNWSITNH